jgi:cyclopropane fatty-acyl-phospholipid synthase-like methyltransferase
VLEVAAENAKAAGLSARHHLIPGSAFEVPLGSGYDIILLTNFLHHFSKPANEAFLRKVHSALAPKGRAVTVEFVPNEDRVTPPAAATFSLTMLTATPSGDAYTFSDLDGMFRAAGFSSSEQIRFPAGPESAVISKK